MVVSDALEKSNIVDPLVNYTPFSFSLSSSFRPLVNPNSNSLLSHLKNMVSRNPDLLVNEAKIIKDGGMDILESDKTMGTASKDQSEAPVTVSDKNPQERRPGLGLKRAKFTVKPMPSQPDMSQEPSIDIDNLKDPEEFFAAVERMENAKKEMRRLRGEPLMEMDQNHASLQPRRRRPGLLGKSATYKHRAYSSTGVPDKYDSLFSSQEAYDDSILSPTREDALPDTDALNLLPETRVSDAKPAVSTKVSELDELLSCNFDGLDDDGVQSLLQDKLNFKLLDIGKLSLPDMPDVRYREPNKKDTIYLTNDSNEAASSKPLTYSYQFKKSSSNQLSPSLSKSPLASISSLNKNISRLTPSKDPFSTLDIDSSPDVFSFPEANNRKQADQIGKTTDSHDFSSFPVNGEETNGALTSPFGLSGNSRSSNIESEERLDGLSLRDQFVTSDDSHEIERSPARGEKNIAVFEKLPSPIAKDITPVDDPEDCLRSPIEEENFAVSDEALLACEAKDVHATSVPTEQDDQTVEGLESVGKEILSKDSFMENASVNGGDGEIDDPSNIRSILIEKPNKQKVGSRKSKRKQTEESTEPSQENSDKETVKKGRNKKAKSNGPVLKEPTNKKRKVEGASLLPSNVDEKLRRHSLYAAGTKLEDGLRRSTRIRMRPLEYWRGERFLYGRVHNSMISVIGVKYASPAKNAEEERAVKVKSFVSDEYKDLLDLASYH